MQLESTLMAWNLKAFILFEGFYIIRLLLTFCFEVLFEKLLSWKVLKKKIKFAPITIPRHESWQSRSPSLRSSGRKVRL